MKSRFFLCRALGVVLCLLAAPCGAEISFSGLDLAQDNRLLFTANSSGGGNAAQSALLLAKLPGKDLSLLSVFPEKMELSGGGKTLLVHNAFGSHRLPVEGGLPRSFPGFSSFGGSGGGRVERSAASPDGRWLIYVEPSGPARGDLILLDGISGKKRTVSVDVDRPGRFAPALWDPDSRGFLYARKGRLYFYTVTVQSEPPDERYRVIGDGTLASLRWGKDGVFYYVRGSSVYRLRGGELFARTLYSSFLDLGTLAGTIPFEFDPNFDRFWIAPDGLSMLFCKGGRTVFFYPLGTEGDAKTDFASLPFSMLPSSVSGVEVLWPTAGAATVLVRSSSKAAAAKDAAAKNAASVSAYRLAIGSGGKAEGSFETLGSPPGTGAALSPDGKRILFWGMEGLYLYDYQSWEVLARLAAVPVYSALWLGNEELVVGGAERIERVRLSGNAAADRKLLCLASASRYGFEEITEGTAAPLAVRRILGFSGNAWYASDGESPWTRVESAAVREAGISSANYRVYLESRRGFFTNIPMVRNVSSVGTFPLFESGIRAAAGTENRRVALCFDLYDDASGLPAALAALERFGIRATFFVNGEFIRRNPEAAKVLAESGHEVASMFFAPIDLSDVRYRIDKTFVERGLARNEDEYYRATGRELALLWHPPFYSLSKEIADTAAAAGYRSVTRGIDPRDWMLSADAKRLGLGELSAAEMIELVMDSVRGGEIIPIRLGVPEGGRPDYLFNNLEVLLDALLREGYEILPVSSLPDKGAL
jgi:peptidoglycan/xylan/chitin deacetylase (PgdA/CDA1 family)